MAAAPLLRLIAFSRARIRGSKRCLDRSVCSWHLGRVVERGSASCVQQLEFEWASTKHQLELVSAQNGSFRRRIALCSSITSPTSSPKAAHPERQVNEKDATPQNDGPIT
eukprot:scaffold272266_cov30-Tisochrysis_lutea.AAC.3